MTREMNDSGQGWLDQIPCTWDISKVSLFFDVQLGKMLQPNKSQDTDTLENYISAANVGGNTLKLDLIKSMWFSTSEKTALKIHVGGLLVVEGGDIARCDIASQECDGLLFQNSIFRVRPLERRGIRFLKYVLWTAKSRCYIDLIFNKATIAHFSKDKFLSIPYPVAPYTKQVLIVDLLDRECAEIDAVLTKTRKSIKEYKKLRQAVITSVKANLVDPVNYLELPQVSPDNIEKCGG